MVRGPTGDDGQGEWKQGEGGQAEFKASAAPQGVQHEPVSPIVVAIILLRPSVPIIATVVSAVVVPIPSVVVIAWRRRRPVTVI